MLEMAHISKRFGATIALDDVSLTVKAGSVLALIGENGAGKSTLMKILSGAEKPDSGTMTLAGRSYHPTHPRDGRRAGIGMIYQELSLAPHLTVEENILLGCEPTTYGGFLNKAKMRHTALSVLSLFDHPDIQPDTPVRRLSVAACQLVEIARAVAAGCRVIVFDEPTSSLSQVDTQRLFELIRRLKQQGIAIVYISHFLEEVTHIADTYAVLRDGRLVATGQIKDVSIGHLAALMVGRQIEQMYVRSVHPVGEILLTVEHLTADPKPIDIHLQLRRGQVLGIAGLVGAGRTELLRCIFGLKPIKTGRIKVGYYAGAATPALRWRQGIGFLSEDRKSEGLALTMSIADNITLTMLERIQRYGWIFSSTQARAIRPLVENLAIKCRHPFQPVAALSGGNQQKVAFARLLFHNVDILLLDEPTRGIDVMSKFLIYQYIDQLAKGDPQRGIAPKAILVVSSYLPELFGICDQIAVMCRGRLTPPKPTEQWTEAEVMLCATGAATE